MPRRLPSCIRLKTARATARGAGTRALGRLARTGRLHSETHRDNCLTELRALLAAHDTWTERAPLWALVDFCERWPLAGQDYP